jgi:hypothetical protein
MDIELLGKEAINVIKSTWGLPKSGFIAGGSISNIVWELVSGNKAVVNDVDVFVFEKYIENIDKENKDNIFNYEEKDIKYYETYAGLSFQSIAKDFYAISKSEIDGIFNTVSYQSNTTNPYLILQSFDINSTKIGYSIEEDKIYYTKEFEDFLKTGELKICNLLTPAHTAIRLAKKSKELNAKLDEFEFQLIKYVLSANYSDIIKQRFKERYSDLYTSYIHIIGKHFKIDRDVVMESYIKKQFNCDDYLYFLIPIISESNLTGYSGVPRRKEYISGFDILSIEPFSNQIFNDENLNSVFRTTDFLFYMRNIYPNTELKKIWKSLYYFWSDSEYLDKEVDKEDLDLLGRFAQYAPGSINNLKGMKLSEQINLIKKFLDKFKHDPLIAISILENIKIDKSIELDDQTSLILELTVRKEIVNDTKNKVRNILNIKDVESDDNLTF